MVALIPVVAISPILLYIGMLIGAQAFQETPKSHAPAIILALMPHLAAWGKLQIDNALGAAGHQRRARSASTSSGRQGILYQGLEVLGGGVDPGRPDARRDRASFIIDRNVHEGGGLRAGRRGADLLRLHARREDRHRRVPGLALSYLGVAAVLFACARSAAPYTAPMPMPEVHGGPEPLPAAE